MACLFKETDLAARRLRVLAEVFAPSSRAFLRDVVNEFMCLSGKFVPGESWKPLA